MASSQKLPGSRPEFPLNASSIYSDRAPTNPAELLVPSVDRYLHRISIEGMDYYLRAPSKFERRFWLLIILVGMGGTLVYLIPAFTQYLDFTTVFQIEYRTSPDFSPPNTWLCRLAVNYSYFYDRFDRVKPQIGRDKRVELIVKRFTATWLKVYGIELTVDKVLDFAMSYITMQPFADNVEWTRYIQPQLLNEVLNKAIEAMGSEWTGIRTFYEEGFFDCPSYLRYCSLNGFPFDCCRDSVSGYNNQADKCYKVDIRRELKDHPNLLKRGEPIELSIEASADSRYYQRDRVDTMGVRISFQTQLPSGFDRINPLAAGTASKINVKGTRKIKISDCIERYRYSPKLHSDADPLVQQYFKDMQEQKNYSMDYCTSGRLIEAMSIRCGCVPYIDTLKPNDTIICTPAHIYACYYSAFQDTPEMAAMEKDAGVKQNDIFVDLKDLIASACVPLCDTWSYEADVFSTIMDGDEGNISEYWRNKVTVIFDPEYRVETEMLQMNLHAFIASVGDGLGLMLGMSFISFVQLAVWTVAALCSRRRLRRVGPLVEEDMVVKFDQIPQQNGMHMNAGSNPKVTITITEVG